MRRAYGASRAHQTPPVTSQAPDAQTEAAVALPRDHPAWQRDVLSVSARTRSLLATLRPVVVRALTFWDHVVRAVSVGRRRVEVDPSGCYRVR